MITNDTAYDVLQKIINKFSLNFTLEDQKLDLFFNLVNEFRPEMQGQGDPLVQR